MTRFARPALGLLLLAGLAGPARAADADPLLPAQTESVAVINVRQILDSELIQKFALGQIKQALQGNDAKKTMEELGLNPLTDIDRVSFGSWGKDADDMKVVGVAHGKFDLDKLFKAAEEQNKKDKDKVEIVTVGKYKLVKIMDEKQKQPVFVTGVDEKTLIGGNDKDLVAAVRAAAAAGGKPELKKELAALVAAQDEKASVFVVGLADGKKVEFPPGVNLGQVGIDQAKLAKQLGNLRSLTMTLRLTDGVNLDFGAGLKDADSAEEFGDTLGQLVGTVKTFLPIVAGQQPQFKPLADEVGNTLKSRVKDKDVKLTLRLSGTAIGKVAGGAGGDDK